MSILDRAKAHFGNQPITKIVVPEWPDESGKPTVLYSQPFTLADRKKLMNFAQEDELEFIVRLVIMKCEDENGEKVFDLSDKPVFLSKVDPNVVSRIAAQIANPPSPEEQLGN